MKNFIKSCTILLIFYASSLSAQNISGIVNAYYPVSSVAGNVVAVGAGTGAAHTLAIGDYVVLIQMTGPPPVQAGSNMGNYELRKVTAVSGSSITLDGITQTYTPSTEKVQLVWVPYSATGFTVTATVTAKAWDGTTGGIITLKGNTLTLNASIDASGSGFNYYAWPTYGAFSALSGGLGSTDGRGFNGTGQAGKGGGGIAGGGGAGGFPQFQDFGRGGSIGNGGTRGSDEYGNPGVNGLGLNGGVGFGTTVVQGLGFGSGGGGGVIGGGGGGGGGVFTTSGGGGGGGGVTGGGGGGGGGDGAGGGGGVKGVGIGGNASCQDGCGGAGGGSYGGGGGAASSWAGGDDSQAGGGGGSWSGGGLAGISGEYYSVIGGAGNSPVSVEIDNLSHYLNKTQPKLMLGGAGGNSQCQIGGYGGGIVIMDFNSVTGNNFAIRSNGEPKGLAINCFDPNVDYDAYLQGVGAAGGGAGGQMLINVKDFTSNTILEAKGGKGGDGNNNNGLHGGVGGAGGGGGGIWVYATTISTNTGGKTVSVANTNLAGAGATAAGVSGGSFGAYTNNPKNYKHTGTGGAGGNGLIVQSSDIPSWSGVCAITLTSAAGACTPATNKYDVTGDLTFSDAPTTGTLTVSDGSITQVFNAPFTSPQAYTLSGLTADGASHTVTAVFSADGACTNTSTYTAPVSCACVKPNAGIDQSPVCVGNTAITTATLAATAVAGGAWTQVSTNPAGASITDAASATSGVTGLTPGVYQFIWSSTATCSDTVQITIPSCACVKPNAGIDQSPVCVGNTAITTTTLAATAVAGGAWTQVATNPAGATITTPSSATSGVTGLTPGVYQFIWSSTATCSDTVKITIPSCACVKPNAGTDQAPTCVGSTPITTATLAATAVAGGAWTQVSTNPAGASITDAASATSGVTGLTPGVYQFIWSSSATCSDTVKITIPNCACVKPNAGTDQAPVCVGNTAITTATLAATAVAGGAWTQVSTNPAGASITDAASATSGVTGLTPGVYQFIWSSSATCSDTVQITIPNCACVKPNAGTDQSPACVGNTAITTATLAATAVTGGAWTQVATNPAGAVVTTASSATSTVTGLTPGVYQFIWATTATCSDTVTITIPNCACVKPNAGTDQSPACVGNTAITTATLAATAVTGGAWTQVATNPAGAVVTTASSATSTVTGLTPGVYQFIWATTATCSDTVTITIPNCACTKPSAGTDQTICSVTTATLTGTSPTTGTWSAKTDNPAGATLGTTTAGVVTVTFATSATGTFSFIYTSGTCTDTVAITRFNNPVNMICPGESYTITAPTGYTNFKWYKDGVLIAGQSAATYKVTTAGSYTVSGVNASSCKDSLCCPYVFKTCGSLGDYVWKDTNNDGIQNETGTGVKDVILELYKNGVATGIKDTTDIDGKYLFAISDSASYQVKIISALPAGCTISTMQNTPSDDAKDSDFNPTTGLSDAVTVNPLNPAKKDVLTVDAALFSPKGSLGDYVWKDTNNDGIQNETGTGVKDVILELYKNGVATGIKDTTDIDGKYLFTISDSASYQVKIISALPAGCTISTKQNTPSDDTKDSDFNPTTGLSDAVTVNPLNPAKKDVLTVDAALFSPKGSLGDYVWKDTNNDGIQNETGTGVKDVILELYKNGVATGIKDTTDIDGKYLFTISDSASYQVKIISALPAGCTISTKQNTPSDDTKDSDFNPTTGLSDAVTVNPLNPAKKDVLTVDAALFSPKGSLGDYVWKDTNNDGIQNETGTGVKDVILELYKNGVATGIKDTTDIDGKYLFAISDSASYQVKIISALPAGCTISTKQNTPSDDTKDSDFNPTTGLSDAVTVNPLNPAKKDVLTVDAALYSPKGSLGDYVWKDTNNDGIQNETGTGVKDIILELYKNGVATGIKDTTDIDGKYLFAISDSASYQVKIISALPAGCTISTKQNAATGTEATDSDFNPTTGMSDAVTVNPLNPLKKDVLTVDAALYSPKGSLGDYVWKDTNNDGIQNETGTGVKDVILELYKNGVATGIKDTTDIDGKYLFAISDSASYQVKIISALPAGCTISTKQNAATGTEATDSDFNPTTGLSDAVTVNPLNPAKKDVLTVDAALFSPKGSLGDYVWKDTNNDGIQNETGTGVKDVILELYKNGAATGIKDTTDIDGKYLFAISDSASYQVKIISALPAGCTISTKQNAATGTEATDSDFNPTTGLSDAVTVNPLNPLKKDVLTVDAALYSPKGSLGDYVWKDTNNDGIQNETGTGVIDVILELYKNGVATGIKDTTDVDGKYLFAISDSASYQVKIISALPIGCTISTKQNAATGTEATDSDFNAAGLSDAVTVNPLNPAKKDVLTVDAALVTNCSVIAKVNSQSMCEGGTPKAFTATPATGVTYAWYGPLADTTSTLGTAIGTATLATYTPTGTFAVGKKYYAVITTQGVCKDTAFATLTVLAKPAALTICPSETYTITVEAGATSIQWYKDGVAVTGAAGTANTYTVTTAGTYTYSAIKAGGDLCRDTLCCPFVFMPCGSLGDYVWKDTNNDGIQNETGTGVKDVILELYKNGVATGIKDTTDIDGKYLFTISDSASYQVKIISALPAGCTISTKQNAATGTEATDSDFNPTTGLSDAVTVNPLNPAKKDVLTVDAALYSPKGSLGDYVWKDSNNDGIQNETGTGVKDVILELYKNGVATGIKDTTDIDGKYLFTISDSASYQVKIISALPAGCTISTMQNTPSDDTKDSDFNPTTGLSDAVTVNPLNPAKKDVLTVDAALYSPKGSLGDYVWKDTNNDGIQNETGTGVKDVILELYKNGVATGIKDTTDIDGKYLFAISDSASYQVKIVSALPAGCTISTMQNTPSDDTKDSDFNPTTGLSDAVTVNPLNPAKKDVLTVDAALYSPKGSLGDYVWKDTNNDGIQNETGTGVKDVILELYKNGVATGIKDTTDIDGKYLFAISDSASYQVKIISALPAGCTISTKQNAATGTEATDSDFNPTTGLSDAVTVNPLNPAKKDVLTVDAALYSPKGSLGDYVWKDTNNDGIQNETGTGVKDVILELYKNGVATGIKDTTDIDGKYLFAISDSASYQVKIISTLPAGCTISTMQNTPSDDTKDSDFNPTTGLSDAVTVNPLNPAKKDVLTVDAALYSPKGSLGDYVWKDTNNDGIQNETGTGVKDIILELYKNGVATGIKDTTDIDGKYLFAISDSASYQVKIISALPTGCTISTKQNAATGTEATDSDFNPTTGLSDAVTVNPLNPAKKDVLTVDAALFSPKGSLGDYVWKDTNNDGIQNETGTGVKDVILELYKNGVATGIKDTTDIDGKYLFAISDSASYQVKIISALPAGCTISTKQNTPSDDTKDSDFNPTTGLSDAVTVNPLNPAKKDVLTVDAALYSPKGSLGDYVWKDTNNDGIQNETGTGVKDVILELYKNGVATGIKDTTDIDGKYLFAISDSASYQVKIISALPAGCTISTKQNAATGTEATDSDFNPTTGLSDAVTVNPLNPAKKDVLTVDAALYSPKGSLGDYVWKDTNNDGIQNETGTGVKDIILELYKNGVATGIKDTTDIDGKYLFAISDSASYQVKIISALPAGCTISTKQNASTGTEATDSDFNPTTGMSDAVTVNPLNPAKKDVLTVDAALYTPCVKPNAGTDQQLICSGTTQITTATLAATAITGGSWSQVGSTPNVATITNVTLANSTITGLVPGTYQFVWSTKTDCSDTVQVIVPNCACVSQPPFTSSANLQVCKGDTFPTMKVSIIGTGTVDWYKTATGGIAISTNTLSYKPSGVVTATDSFYVQAVSFDSNCPFVNQRTKIIINAQNCIDTIDLHLTKKVDKKTVQLGDVITYTIKVWNESSKNATGVEVTDQLPAGVQYVSSVASRGNYNNTTGVWTIGNIAHDGDTVTLSIQAKIIAEGVTFNTAQISKADQKDKDSTPGNNVDGEDDLDRVCITTPFKLCVGQGVDVTIPSTYTGIVWKDAQGNIVPSSGNSVTFTKAGIYSFTATNGTCPTGGCCPVIVEEINCCPAEICIPFTIKKRRI